MKPEAPWDLERRSWSERHPLLPVLLGLTLLLLVGSVLGFMETGAPTIATGPITKVGQIPFRRTSQSYAVVDLPGGAVRADSLGSINCAIGDRVRVWRTRHLLWSDYRLDVTSCPASGSTGVMARPG